MEPISGNTAPHSSDGPLAPPPRPAGPSPLRIGIGLIVFTAIMLAWVLTPPRFSGSRLLVMIAGLVPLSVSQALRHRGWVRWGNLAVACFQFGALAGMALTAIWHDYFVALFLATLIADLLIDIFSPEQA